MHRPGLIFDLDGTLSDPREGILRCFRIVLEALEVRLPDDDDLHWCIGPPLDETFAAIFGSRDRVPDAIRAYRRCYANGGLFENFLYPGMADAIREMHGLAPRMFVATSKPHDFANRILDRFRLTPFFHAVYGCEMNGDRADKTELVAWLLRREGVAASDFVLIGDRKHDVLAARANGLPSVGVTWGFGSVEELTSAGADVLCSSVADLVEWYRGATL